MSSHLHGLSIRTTIFLGKPIQCYRNTEWGIKFPGEFESTSSHPISLNSAPEFMHFTLLYDNTLLMDETWCRRWWHISQRSLSLSAGSYSPRLNPLLMKQLKEPKITERQAKKTARVTSAENVEVESVPSAGELYPIY
ncbi:hypothetical protein X777_03145 [Ooceraea biroi]|uniref:Uncharacterized protein n=1 Tax=Ooceraea biroi TaxID=2015173 RepID=A0A026WMS9_OOCBI|nr:hypothetical protein X777_03145 [Ooceraea biroi]